MSNSINACSEVMSRATKSVIETLERRQLLVATMLSSQAFQFETEHRLDLQFNKDVSASLGGNDLTISNLTQNTQLTASQIAVGAGVSNKYPVRFQNLPGAILPDGNYQSIVNREGIEGSDGLPLINDFSAAFFVFAADVNHDRTVNQSDMNLLFSNYGTMSGATHSMGDTNYDGKVNSVDYNSLSGRFGVTMPAPPSHAGSVNALAESFTSIRVNWYVSDDPTINGYRIYRSLNGVEFSQVGEVRDPLESTWVDNGPLVGGTKYWYRVRAFSDAAGNSASVVKYPEVTPMQAPNDLTISNVTDDGLTLNWTDNSSTEAHFSIERATGDGEFDTWYEVERNVTSYDVTGLDEGTEYRWRVCAWNDDATSAFSLEETATTLPATPTNMIASIVESTGHLRVTWENQSASATGFLIKRFPIDGGGNVGTSPDATVTVGPDVSSYTFCDTNQFDKYAVTVTTLGTGGSTSAQTSQEQSQVEPTQDWTPVFNHQSPITAAQYVTHEWAGDEYGNGDDSITLTLNNLPRHTWLAIYGTFWEVNTNPDAWMSVDVGGQYYEFEKTGDLWHVGTAPLTTGGAIQHTGNDITITISTHGFSEGPDWSPATLYVSTYLPHVEFWGDGMVVEDESGGGIARFGMIRGSSWSSTIDATDLPVKVKDAGGSAKVDEDYAKIETLTIPAFSQQKIENVNPVDDNEIEGRYETVKLAVVPDKTYALLYPECPTAENQIRDEDWRIASIEVDYDSQGIKYDSGPDVNDVDQYTGPEWVDGVDGALDSKTEAKRKHVSDGTEGHPINLQRNTPESDRHLSATVVFGLEGNPLEGQWELVGGATGPVGGGWYATDDLEIVAPENELTYVGGSDDFSDAIPQLIRNGELNADWTIVDPTLDDDFYRSTKNHVYVTGASASGALETVLEIGCQKADGKRPRNPGEGAEDVNFNGVLDGGEDANSNGVLDDTGAAHERLVIEAIWSEFTDKKVYRADGGGPMAYWGEYAGFYSTAADLFDTAGLLKNLDGRCGAWADFLTQIYQTQGITAYRTKIVADDCGVGFRMAPVMPPPGTASYSIGLYVKSNLEAQGNPDPWNLFDDHAVVKVSVANRVLDPSYGAAFSGTTMHDAEQQWEKDSLSGFQWVYKNAAEGYIGNSFGVSQSDSEDETIFMP